MSLDKYMDNEVGEFFRKAYNWIFEEHKSFTIGFLLCLPVFYLYFYALSSIQDKVTYILNDTFLVFLMYFIASLSLDLEVGSLGLPNFGKVAFIAIGAYITTIVMNMALIYQFFGIDSFILDFLLGLAMGCIISAFFGWLIAIPSVKLRADYFAIMTIAAGEIVRLVLQNEKRYFWRLTNPELNIREPLMLNTFRNDIANVQIFGLKFSETFKVNFGVYHIGFGNNILFTLDLNFGSIFYWQLFLFFFFLGFALLCYFFVEIIRKSPYGRALRAIREDDITVTSVGKDVFSYRWQVTVIAAVICSIAGSLFSILNSSFEPIDFKPTVTFLIFVFIIIGGIGNSRGVAFGTLLIQMFNVATASQIVRDQLSVNVLQILPIINIPFTNISINFVNIFGPILADFQIKLSLGADFTRFVILGAILLLFLLYRPEGLIPEPKSNNQAYLSLLADEERRDSDLAVERNQSSSERDRIDAQADENELEGDFGSSSGTNEDS